MGKKRAAPVSDEDIVRQYQISQSEKKTAEALGIGATTVHRVLTKLSVPMFGVEHWRSQGLYRGCELDMRRDYECGANYTQLIQKYGPGSIWSVKDALRRAGTVLRENVSPEMKPGELERIRELNAEGMGQVGISLALGRSQSFVSRAMRRHSIGTHGGKVGPGHGSWTGGRFRDGNGYMRVWMNPDDPMASMRLHDGYVLEHRLVMARKLGRVLRRTETVHHVDGDHINNHPDNLQLRQGRHGKHTAWVCLDCGSHNIAPAPLADDPSAGNGASTSLFE